MKWIIECGINTANNLGSPTFKKKEKNGANEARKRGEETGKEKRGEREKIPATLWGEKLLLKSY